MKVFTFFYGGPLSQWYPSKFKIGGITYVTTEQWMMAEKARLFGDNETLSKIISEQNPHTQKAWGRQVKRFNADEWNGVSRDVVYRGNYEKFTQNNTIRYHLLQTEETILVEASPTDRLWGIGLGMDTPSNILTDTTKWRGVNWLGEVLTKVRDDIINGMNRTSSFNWQNPVHVYETAPPI